MGIDFASLQGLDKEGLTALLNEAKSHLKEIEEVEQGKKEEQHAADLQPFKDNLVKLEALVKKVADAFDVKIQAIKDQKTVAQDEARKQVTEYLNEYNGKRKELGLSEVSVSTRKRSEEPQHRYDIVWPKDPTDCSLVQITVDDHPPSTPIDLTAGVTVEPIRSLFESLGIRDESGGRSRGLVNKVKKALSDRVAKTQKNDAAKPELTPESAESA